MIAKGDWSDHLNKIERVLKNQDNRLKCNIENSLFGKTQMEYLGFWVMQTGIHPVNKKKNRHSKYDTTKEYYIGA